METNSFVSTYRKRIDVVQNSVEQKLEPASDVSIGKILCVNANACIENVEVLNGEAYYNGEVVFNAVLTDEQGNLFNVMETSPLQGKIENNFLNATMLPIYKVEVVNVSIQNASSSGLKANALVEITLDCLASDTINSFVPTGENIKIKTDVVNVYNVQNNGQATFSVSEDLEVKAPVNEILFKCANVCIKDVKSGTGYFTINGEVNFNMSFVSGDEESKTVKCLNQTFPFTEEIEVEDLTKEEIVQLMVNVKPEDIVVTIGEVNELKTTLNINVPVQVKYYTMNRNEREITTDAYSTTNNVNLVSESFSYIKSIQSQCENKTIDCELTLQDDQERISKVLFVCGENVSVTNNYVEDERLFVEGIVSANVVYLADNDNYEVCSVVAECPFKIQMSEEVVMADDIFVKTTVKGCSCRAKKGKELDLEFDVNVLSEAYLMGQGVYLKEVELAEKLEVSPYSLQIYFAPKNSDVWSISKHLKVTPEVITSQNPDLVFPLEKPEQVVYFIQK